MFKQNYIAGCLILLLSFSANAQFPSISMTDNTTAFATLKNYDETSGISQYLSTDIPGVATVGAIIYINLTRIVTTQSLQGALKFTLQVYNDVNQTWYDYPGPVLPTFDKIGNKVFVIYPCVENIPGVSYNGTLRAQWRIGITTSGVTSLAFSIRSRNLD